MLEIISLQHVKKLKKRRFQRRTLNDYLSSLYLKLMAEKPELKVSFATFAKMRPAHYVLVNFIKGRSYLCTKNKNMPLRLKMLKTYNKLITSHPDNFIKN